MRFLLVTSYPPYPPNVGGRQRTNLLFHALRKLGEVDLVLIDDESFWPPGTNEVLLRDFNLVGLIQPVERAERGFWRWLRPLHSRLVNRIAHNLGSRWTYFSPTPAEASRFDAIVAAKSYDLIVGRYLAPTARSGALNYGPVILDVDDVEIDNYRTRILAPSTSLWQKWVLGWHVWQLERIYPALLARCAGLWVSNPSNSARKGLEDAKILPNIPFGKKAQGDACDSLQTPSGASSTILMVGMMTHQPNVEAVDWFLSQVWPLILREIPAARFRIVGFGLSKEIHARWWQFSGVEPVGPVESVQGEYQGCAFTIAPLHSGAGTNIKVLESYSFGRACVATQCAHRGYETTLPAGEIMLVSDQAAEFARHCITLLLDPGLRATLAERGRSVVASRYSAAAFENAVADLVQAVQGRYPQGVSPQV